MESIMKDKTGILSHGDCSVCCCGCGSSRREFLQVVGLGAAASLAGTDAARAMAGPFDASDFARLVPPDKKLDPAWVKSLFDRGESRRSITATSLATIGMPIGGICAGQLYLGGDGKLWHWDIFNRRRAHERGPLRASDAARSRRWTRGSRCGSRPDDKTEVRTLDRAGFSDIRFRGEYPIGFVEYRDPTCRSRVDWRRSRRSSR